MVGTIGGEEESERCGSRGRGEAEEMENEREMKQSRFSRICVFCGSSQGKKRSYQDAAVELGGELVLFCFLFSLFFWLRDWLLALQWILITICLVGIFVHGLVHSVLFLAVPCGSCSKRLSCNASVKSLVLLFFDSLDACSVVCVVEVVFVLHVVPLLVLFFSCCPHSCHC